MGVVKERKGAYSHVAESMLRKGTTVVAGAVLALGLGIQADAQNITISANRIENTTYALKPFTVTEGSSSGSGPRLKFFRAQKYDIHQAFIIDDGNYSERSIGVYVRTPGAYNNAQALILNARTNNDYFVQGSISKGFDLETTESSKFSYTLSIFNEKGKPVYVNTFLIDQFEPEHDYSLGFRIEAGKMYAIIKDLEDSKKQYVYGFPSYGAKNFVGGLTDYRGFSGFMVETLARDIADIKEGSAVDFLVPVPEKAGKMPSYILQSDISTTLTGKDLEWKNIGSTETLKSARGDRNQPGLDMNLGSKQPRVIVERVSKTTEHVVIGGEELSGYRFTALIEGAEDTKSAKASTKDAGTIFMSPQSILFIGSNAGQEASVPVQISNNTQNSITINKIELATPISNNGIEYARLDPEETLPVTIGRGEKRAFKLLASLRNDYEGNTPQGKVLFYIGGQSHPLIGHFGVFSSYVPNGGAMSEELHRKEDNHLLTLRLGCMFPSAPSKEISKAGVEINSYPGNRKDLIYSTEISLLRYGQPTDKEAKERCGSGPE